MARNFASGFPTDEDYYNDSNPENRQQANVLDDDFDDVIAPQLTAPTAEATVAAAVAANTDTPVILWRGTTGPSAQAMVAFNCAKGQQRDLNTTRPSDAERRQQIALGRAFPEFTTSKNLGFSFGHSLVVVKVSAKYLCRGSAFEQGWVCRPTAPLEVLEVVDRTLGFNENLNAINAS